MYLATLKRWCTGSFKYLELDLADPALIPSNQARFINSLITVRKVWPHLQDLSPLLGQGPQLVPQVTDALAALVDCSHIVIVQLTAHRHSDRGFYSVSAHMSHVQL